MPRRRPGCCGSSRSRTRGFRASTARTPLEAGEVKGGGRAPPARRHDQAIEQRPCSAARPSARSCERPAGDKRSWGQGRVVVTRSRRSTGSRKIAMRPALSERPRQKHLHTRRPIVSARSLRRLGTVIRGDRPRRPPPPSRTGDALERGGEDVRARAWNASASSAVVIAVDQVPRSSAVPRRDRRLLLLAREKASTTV